MYYSYVFTYTYTKKWIIIKLLILVGIVSDDSITQVILPYAMYWKGIGMLLDVDSKTLVELEQTSPNDFIRCCKEMINKWLQNDRNASQKKLIVSTKMAAVTSLQMSSSDKILNGMDL